MGNLPCKKGYRAINSSLTSLEITQAVADKCVFVALSDFPPCGRTDLTIRFGEQLNILSEDGEWCKVFSVSTGRESFMPKNYIAKVCNRWLFKGVNREKAEEMLLVNCNCSGSFLIRESETRRGSYTLSVRRTNQNVRDSIKHYRINCLDNGWFYISPRLTFASLQDMVNYYSEIADGICCILKDPCIVQMVSSTITHRTTEPAIVTNPTFNWKEVDRSTLLKEDTSCPLSLGLREAVSSYMFLTQESDLEKDDWWNTC